MGSSPDMGARPLTGERPAPVAASGEEAPSGTRIQLCGPLRATIAGRAVEGALPGRKGRLALAYLVVNRDRPVARDERAAVPSSRAGRWSMR